MLPIKEFPDDEDLWRIEWLGEIEQLPHEARVAVHLRKVVDQAAAFRSAAAAAPGGERRTAKVGIGQLPFLTHGSCWRSRRRVEHFAVGASTRLRGIRVEAGRVQSVALNHDMGTTETGRKRWLLPPYVYPLPAAVYASRCLAIEHDGDPFGIVVPAAEVARFYYAPSSDMAHTMFRGRLELDPRRVLNLSRSGLAMVDGARRMVVARAQDMSDNDCWVLGRILGDDHARAGAKRIYDSLLEATANGARTFVETGIPFRGVAEWSVRAVNVGAHADVPRWLVLEIQGCSAAFPFDELEVVADNDGRAGNPATDRPDDEKKTAYATYSPPQAVIESGDELQSREPPRAGVNQIVLANPSVCYEALLGKSIIKTPKDECRYKSGQLKSTLFAGNDVGTGEGAYGQTAVKPAEVVWDKADADQLRTRRKALNASFEVLYDVVDEINKIDGASASVRESKAVAFIPLTEPANDRQWSWLDSATRTPREVMIVDVAVGDRSGCLVEFRQRPTERCAMGLIVCQGQVELSDAELNTLLFRLAKSKGVWKNVDPRAMRAAVRALRHTKPTPADLAAHVVTVLRPMLRQ